ncbi:MAG: hypothetical protein IKA02_04985, partial [Clostridia bacterium]|nr:hypothetical protein [Clostridia bacterium]
GLSLIPLIAEIFGITTDELLRGERNNGNVIENGDINEKLSIKSEKQFKLMLHNNKRKYDNLSLISIGIIIVGLIAAIICNLGFNRGLLGFFLGSVFFIAGIICQVCFTVNSRFLIDEEEILHIDVLKKANTDRTMKCVHILFFVSIVWAFCLPIAILSPNSNWGLNFESWLLYGAAYSGIGFIICFLVYRLIVLKTLLVKDIVFLTDKDGERINKDNGLLKRSLIVFIIIFLFFSLQVTLLTSFLMCQVLLKGSGLIIPMIL